MGFLARFCADPDPQPSPRTRNLASAEEKNVWERERDCVDRRRADNHEERTKRLWSKSIAAI